MENVTLVIRIDAGLINVNPETVEEALNKYFAPDGAVSVFYAAQQPLALDAATARDNFPTCDRALRSNWVALATPRK